MPGRPTWVPNVLADLYERVVEHPDTSHDPFMVKLRRQLSTASAEVVQLAAELCYAYLLMPSNTGAATKRKQVQEILSWSPAPVAVPSNLDRAFGNGIASVGAARAQVPQHMRFLLELARAWHALPAERRDAALKDPWAFKEFVFELPAHSAFVEREALLHLVHPDRFEPIVAREMKRQIVEQLSPRKRNSVADEDIDRELLAIRQRLEERFGSDFTFWDPQVAAHPPRADPPPSEVCLLRDFYLHTKPATNGATR
jgi:5-methylcytosine-specific restriction protein B